MIQDTGNGPGSAWESDKNRPPLPQFAPRRFIMNSDDEAEEERRTQEEAAKKQTSKDTTTTTTSWDIKREACGTAAAEGKSLLVVRFSKQQL